jgi:hypothetical protein
MVLRMQHGSMRMLCGQNNRIFFNILKILMMLCKSCTDDSEKIRGEDCNIPQ